MKKIVALLLLLVLRFSTYAQQEVYAQSCFWFQNGTSTYTFSDSMNVREAPHLNAAIKDTLPIGTEVFIDEKTDSLLVASGKAAPWFLVHYVQNNVTNRGFVWGGNLCLSPMRRANTKFLIGLKGIVKRRPKEGDDLYDVMVAELKTLRNDSVIAKVSWDVGSTENLASNGAKVITASGLKNVQYILEIYVSGEACGVPTITQHIVWTGTKLVLLPQLISVSDAGVYYHEEAYVFPSDKNGQAGMIIKKIY